MRILLPRIAAVTALLLAPPLAHAAQRVPFVGCAGDGQTGPVAAPNDQPKSIAADAATASRLAYYQAEDSLSVLAPRGWKCFYFYGSDGAKLIVAPSGDLANALQAPLAGPAVTATLHVGGTSGRFAVAKYAARLFPKIEQAFVASVIAEGVEPKEDFPGGPYPADKMTYKTPRLAEYRTPAGADGLGVSDVLKKGALPVVGIAKLDDSPDGPNFLLLAVRLPANDAGLAAAIVALSE